MRQIALAEVNKQVTVTDGKLFFNGHEVRDCDFVKDESVAALYMIRYKDERGNWSIVTGLDLIGDMFWLGGIDTRFYQDQSRVTLPSAFYESFESIERILNTIADKSYSEWAIFEEEDFDKQWED